MNRRGLFSQRFENQKGFSIILILTVILIVVVVGSIVYYISSPTRTKIQPQNSMAKVQTPQLTASSLTPIYIGNYDVVVKIASDSPCNSDTYLHRCKSDIYLKDKTTEKEIYVLTTEDVVRYDARIPIYKNGYIFVVKRTGNDQYPSNDWRDELWVYTKKDQGGQIYSEKGLTFSVNNSATSVAVIPVGLSDNNTIRIISIAHSEQRKDYKIDPKSCGFNSHDTPSSAVLTLRDWNSAGTTLWGDFEGEFATVSCFWKLDITTDNPKYYQVPPNIGQLDAFNPEKAVAIYTDFPPFVDAIAHDNYISANPTFSLYLYDITKKQSTKIDTLPTSFIKGQVNIVHGRWLSPSKLIYSAPDGDKTYNLPPSAP